MIGNFLRPATALLFAALLGMTACSPIERNHGYAPSAEELQQITPGVDTRDSVIELLGEPSASGVVKDGNFYYVKSRFRTFGPRKPREVKREVVVVRFDDKGVVTGIERFGLERGRVVVLSRRTTDGGQTSIGLLRQILGNFGRITAEDILQQQ